MDRVRIMRVADALFNERGVHAVDMATIRDISGVPLKRIYATFASKDELIHEVLRQRDIDARAAIVRYVDSHADAPVDSILAVFDYLYNWFSQPEFRGCFFINAFGEMGSVSDRIADITRVHKCAVTDYFSELVAAAGLPADVADQLSILVNGAMATAGIFATPETAHQAKAIARLLIDASGGPDAGRTGMPAPLAPAGA
ncbi:MULTISPECIES: TetR/AcrR family transcriptional regulator [Streptosporangium]|uniref:AcrR family transcriptional regulator n=1 Tax=Streptosporangium brasiliense TaxID=47480 RepID=A0ABT9RJI4_9ACTN|nr:TetR/AcrR family transcriptional regulator [Streptosporangium brasiliense]MDP9869415.1 AcrR family transcriptional regulator [Streptosporangium brasiliense]